MLTAISAVALAMPGFAQEAIPDSDWRTINRDSAATRYSPLDDINRENVSTITEAWSYPLRAFSTAVPLVVDGVMYLPAGSRVVALDADTGEEIWVLNEPAPANQPPGPGGGFSSRGLG